MVAAPGTQLCPLAGTSPDHPHQGSLDSVSHCSSLSVLVSLWRRQKRWGEHFLPQLCHLLQRSVSNREMGWADLSLPPALAAAPVFPPPVIWPPESWLSLLPKGRPKSLVAGTKGSRTGRPEPGWWSLSHSLRFPVPAGYLSDAALRHQGLRKKPRSSAAAGVKLENALGGDCFSSATSNIFPMELGLLQK